MGFSTLLDILGASLIGGMLLLILFRMNDASSESIHTYGAELIVQQNLVATVQLLEHDFKKIGYCNDWKKIPDPTRAILSADSNKIKFLTDVDNSLGDGGDGIVDTIEYVYMDALDIPQTDNPRDRYLRRIVNNNIPTDVNLGVTNFDLKFYDVLGDLLTFPIVEPAEIYTMEIDVTVESPWAYRQDINVDNPEDYSTVFWKQIRLAARNLRNR